MGCLIILLICIAIFALMVYALGILIGIDIVTGIMLIASIGNYSKSKNMRPSEMKCPNCESSDVRISSVTSGQSTTMGGTKRTKIANTNIQRQRVAKCQSCGFDWNYITRDDIVQAQSDSRGRIIIFGIIFAVCFSFTVYLFYDGDSNGHNGSPDTTQESEYIETL